MSCDRTPHASPACSSEADRAGSCFSLGKTALPYDELCNRLLQKCLDFGSHTRESAKELLARQGYYRLRAYWITFESDGRFIAGTTLDDIVSVMSFDKDISRFILDCIFDIEIALRETLSYGLAQKHGAYVLSNSAIFKNHDFYLELQKTLSRELEQGRRYQIPFVEHYMKKDDPLPIWAFVGLMSFGTLSKIFRNIGEPDLARGLAAHFKLKIPLFASWLRYLTQLRNMCAHQDRLYNIMFAVRPALFREHKGLDTMRLFPAFIVIFRMLESIDAHKAAAARVRFGQIMDAYPTVDLRPVGFPDNWRDYVGNIYGPAASNNGDAIHQRRSNVGRKRKNQAALDEALYLYDTNQGTVAEIAERTGVGHSTLYKYIKLRKQGAYPRMDYAIVKLE